MDAFARPSYINQTSFFDPSKFGYGVTLIGCGGIGASVAPILASFGVSRWELWDDDLVEAPNEAMTTIYGPDDVGHPKVEILARELQRLGTQEVTTHQSRFSATDGDHLDGIVITAVDTMAARQEIWKAVKDACLVPLLLDGRVGGHGYTLCTVDPYDDEHVTWYEEHQLFDDSQAAPLPCTGNRGWVGPAVTLGPLMCSQLAKFLRKESFNRFESDNLWTPGRLSF